MTVKVASLVRLNISGTVFELPKSKLASHPASRLGRIVSGSLDEAQNLCDLYIADRHEFYFSRPADMFACIAAYYCTGRLHASDSPNSCAMRFLEELDYWEVDPTCLAPCCQGRLPIIPISEQKKGILAEVRADDSEPFVHRRQRLIGCRAKLWYIMDKPFDSNAGMVFAAISIGFIVFSTALIIVSSYARFQPPQRRPPYNVPDNATADQIEEAEHNMGQWRRHRLMVALHTTCSVWFTIEYLMRLFASPNRCRFIRHPLSILDIITFVPYYIFWLIAYFRVVKDMEIIRQLTFALRVLRMFQIIRYARYSESYQVMLQTFTLATKELGFLCSLILLLVFVFATIMYFIENTVAGSPFTDIPVAMYWCFITITTVGYGDVTPQGPIGKAFACAMTVLSIIILALPVSIIVSKFSKVYSDADQKEVLKSAQLLHRRLTLNVNTKPRRFLAETEAERSKRPGIETDDGENLCILRHEAPEHKNTTD